MPSDFRSAQVLESIYNRLFLNIFSASFLTFHGFDGLPFGLEGVEAGMGRVDAAGGNAVLDLTKSAFELAAGATERTLGVNLESPSQIDHREQQIADLVFAAALVARFSFKFGNFLCDLVVDRRDIRPVEADAGGTALQFGGAGQGR